MSDGRKALHIEMHIQPDALKNWSADNVEALFAYLARLLAAGMVTKVESEEPEGKR